MLLNIICFQIGWFACVLGSAYQHPWLGVLVAMFLLAFHIVRSKNSIVELRLIFFAMLFGTMFDFVPLSLGWIKFEEVIFWPIQLPPPWMILLWALFASTLNISLNWLKSKPLPAIVLGAISGPLCYWAGFKLKALTLVDFNYIMIYLMLGWAVAVPLLLKVASSKKQISHLFLFKTKES
jgi:hypothetical protein